MSLLRVAIFDDVLALRREVFHIPGLEVGVYGDADDVCLLCAQEPPPDVICMDYAMGPKHVNGAEAIKAVRSMGWSGKIVAMSSDPAANAAMIAAGADEEIKQKAMLRSYLVALGAGRLPSQSGFAALPVLCAIGGAAALVLGVLLVGPLGHRPRFSERAGELGKIAGRVADQASPRSEIDGALTPVEAIEVVAANARGTAPVAGSHDMPARPFEVLSGGRRWRVEPNKQTAWHLADGPSKAIKTPDEVAVGRGLVAFNDTRYSAHSRRIVEGENLYLTGLIRDEGQVRVLAATGIAEEDQRHALGSDVVGDPLAQGAGLALLAAGAILLAVAAARS